MRHDLLPQRPVVHWYNEIFNVAEREVASSEEFADNVRKLLLAAEIYLPRDERQAHNRRDFENVRNHCHKDSNLTGKLGGKSNVP